MRQAQQVSFLQGNDSSFFSWVSRDENGDKVDFSTVRCIPIIEEEEVEVETP